MIRPRTEFFYFMPKIKLSNIIWTFFLLPLPLTHSKSWYRLIFNFRDLKATMGQILIFHQTWIHSVQNGLNDVKNVGRAQQSLTSEGRVSMLRVDHQRQPYASEFRKFQDIAFYLHGLFVLCESDLSEMGLPTTGSTFFWSLCLSTFDLRCECNGLGTHFPVQLPVEDFTIKMEDEEVAPVFQQLLPDPEIIEEDLGPVKQFKPVACETRGHRLLLAAGM